jgi:uncharacterized protein (TIGR02246 family)
MFAELLQLLNPRPKGGYVSYSSDPHESREGDMASIRETVAELERAQRDEDAAAFAALFTSDAVWVTARSRRVTGWREISVFMQSVLPEAMRESAATYEVVLVVFVRPDVAVVSVRERPVTRDSGTADGRSEGSALYVMTREGGRWLIAAGQNTLVRER